MTTVEDLIAKVPMFAGLSGKERKRLGETLKEITFPPGKVIVESGTDGVGFFLVESGTATVSVDGKPRATLKAGDHFGEIALIDEGPRTAQVTAGEGLRCYALTSWEFRPFVQEHPDVAWSLLRSMARRVRELENRLHETSNPT